MTAERQALADAIKAYRQRSAELAAVNEAIVKARDTVFERRQSLAAAEAAIETAKAATADHLVASALGSAGPAPPTIRQARAAHVDATDELTAAQTALAALESRKAEIEASAALATMRRDAAAVAVLRASPEAAHAVAEAERSISDLVRIGSAVLWLDGQKAVSPDAPATLNAVARIRSALPVLYPTISVGFGPDLRDDPDLAGDRTWQTALAALRDDPLAPLPAVA